MIRIAVSLLPVFIFLAALVYLDSFKLIRLQSVLLSIAIGCIAGVLAFFLNYVSLWIILVDAKFYSHYGAPIIEETLKAVYVVYLIRSRKVGFLVDGAIHGFAIGAGFAFTENIYYLNAMESPNLLIWLIRGLGTAVMHGGTTAIFAIITKSLSDRRRSSSLTDIMPGFAVAIVIHSLFNHFFLPPVLLTVCLLIALPIALMIVFRQSEVATRKWLGTGLDTSLELLDMIITGNISQTNIGRYFHSMQDKFPGEIVADMLCLLRIHVELSIRAKGILMMKGANIKPPEDPEVKAKLEELRYLERSIGKTGQLAVAPLLPRSSHDLWQIHMLNAA